MAWFGMMTMTMMCSRGHGAGTGSLPLPKTLRNRLSMFQRTAFSLSIVNDDYG